MSGQVNDPSSQQEILTQLRRLSRRGFAAYLAGLGSIVLGIRWIGTQEADLGISWPLRWMEEINERVWHGIVGTGGIAPEFPRSQAGEPRPNGMYGLLDKNDLKGTNWQLKVESDAGTSTEFSLDVIKSLPRVEQITEFKCIEGWSQVVSWAGCLFVDLAKHSKMATRRTLVFDQASPSDLYRYVSLSTPNEEYFVGLDMSSALHPQTLLAYEMNGDPLTAEHGAPLRLVIPVKYGIKNIKRIGTIRFTDQRPRDYWAERGYDWYAGL